MEYTNQIVQNDMEELLKKPFPYEKLKGKNILVTGASGMLAAYLVYFFMYLNEKQDYGIKVKALVRNEKKAWEKFGAFRDNRKFSLLVQDVCDPIETEANTTGTVNVLEYARKGKTKKVLYTSTREVYGKMPEDVTEITEDLFGSLNPMEFRACYPESKRMAETLCQSYHHQYQIPFTAVRIAHSYGPGMIIDNDGRVMSDFISDIVHNRDIVLKSKGDAERAFCYITDAVSGMLCALLKGEDGEAYNIANETEPYPIREVAKMLTELYPEKGLKVVFDIPETMSAGYSKMGRVKLSTKKLETLGWKCSVSLKDGMKGTVDSFEN